MAEPDLNGLYYYGARWYDVGLGRFISPDTIIPGAGNPQAWDRYAYGNNNPIYYTDPTGHFAWLPVLTIGGALIGAGISYGTQVYNNYQTNGGDLGSALTQNIDLASVGESALAGAAIGLTVSVAAPVVVGMAGEALMGIGALANSTTVFTAGVSTVEASTVIGGLIYGTSAAAPPELPVRTGQHDKTTGVLEAGGERTTLVSGVNGPASQMPSGSRGFNIVTRTHVEGHASALMQQQGWTKGTLYINNPPCASCSSLLPRMLSTDTQLRVIGPNNYDRLFIGQ